MKYQLNTKGKWIQQYEPYQKLDLRHKTLIEGKFYIV